MPLYEFRCPSGHEFEKFYRSISAASSGENCPECGQLAERLMSAAGLVFKGTGFYITDYGKDGKKPQTPAVDPAAAKPAESTTPVPAGESRPAAESKPAASETKPASTPKKAE